VKPVGQLALTTSWHVTRRGYRAAGMGHTGGYSSRLASHYGCVVHSMQAENCHISVDVRYSLDIDDIMIVGWRVHKS
jgi:hypothetical protein